jgi:membrane protease YdiL (CAAX protease family)
VPSNQPLVYRPPISALMLLVAVALALALPAAIAAAALVEGSQDVAAATVLRALCLIGPVFVGGAVWIYRGHQIRVRDGIGEFAFTRYGIRRSVTLSGNSLRSAVFVRGTLALDGRPRPLIEYELTSGQRGWVSLALFGRPLIDALRSELKSRGIAVDERSVAR